MQVLSERALEYAVKVNQALKIIQETSDENIPIAVRNDLITLRTILKGCLKKIDDIFGVEEL